MVTFFSYTERMPAWISSACFRTGGSSLPRFFALRRIPKQAVLLK